MVIETEEDLQAALLSSAARRQVSRQLGCPACSNDASSGPPCDPPMEFAGRFWHRACVERRAVVVPDLILALQGLLLSADCTWEALTGGHDLRKACEVARAAIAKAEGRAP